MEIEKRARTLNCPRPRKVPFASAEADTQVVDLSPLAKSLRGSLELAGEVPEPPNSQACLNSPKPEPAVAAKSPEAKPADVFEPPAAHALKSPVPEPATVSEPEAANALKSPKPEPIQSSKPEPSSLHIAPQTEPEVKACVPEQTPEDDDLFYANATEYITREAQFAQKAECEASEAAAKPKAKAKGRPKAKAQAKKKAKAKANAKNPKPKAVAKAKAKGKAKAKAKAKGGKKTKGTGASKSWDEESEGEALEDDLVLEVEPEDEKPQSEKKKKEAKPKPKQSKPSSKSHDTSLPGATGKASFARRYRPMKDAFAGQKWDCLREAFFLHVHRHVISPSKVEAALLHSHAPVE